MHNSGTVWTIMNLTALQCGTKGAFHDGVKISVCENNSKCMVGLLRPSHNIPGYTALMGLCTCSAMFSYVGMVISKVTCLRLLRHWTSLCNCCNSLATCGNGGCFAAIYIPPAGGPTTKLLLMPLIQYRLLRIYSR